MSLLIREYLSSAVNVLKKRLKNFHVSKSDFCNSITFRVITQDDKGALINIESVLRPAYHVVLNYVHSIVSTNNGILVIRSECVKKTTKEFSRL